MGPERLLLTLQYMHELLNYTKKFWFVHRFIHEYGSVFVCPCACVRLNHIHGNVCFFYIFYRSSISLLSFPSSCICFSQIPDKIHHYAFRVKEKSPHINLLKWEQEFVVVNTSRSSLALFLLLFFSVFFFSFFLNQNNPYLTPQTMIMVEVFVFVECTFWHICCI